MSFLPSAILRAVPGAFIVNSALGKLGADAETSAGMQQMAASGIPALKNLPSDQFGKILGASELAVGGALLSPFVSNRLAGAALSAFGAGLLTMYFKNDSMTESDGIRPSQEGIPLAKDSWLVAMGAALIAMDSSERVRGAFSDRKIRKMERKNEKLEAKLEDD